jgi:preprotein translocase subunit YajC
MLISPVFAETAIQTPSSPATFALPQIMLLIGFIAFFYFLIWRPQLKRQQEKEMLLTALRIGDVVYTSGGIIGKITQLKDNFCQLAVNENTKLYIQKDMIVEVVPHGSLKMLGFE